MHPAYGSDPAPSNDNSFWALKNNLNNNTVSSVFDHGHDFYVCKRDNREIMGGALP